MKTKALLFCVLLASAAFAAQDTFRITRTVEEGQSDTYKLHMSGTTTQGDMDTHMTMVQTIKKVYDNGDADMETAIPQLEVTMGGNAVPVPQPETRTDRVDKFGIPVNAQPQSGGPQRMQFMRQFSAFYGKDLKVGDTVPIDTTDPKDSKLTAKGSVKVDSLTNGEAKLIADVKVGSGESETPSHMQMTILIEVATATPVKVEGSIDQLPIIPGIDLTDVKFSMERAKA